MLWLAPQSTLFPNHHNNMTVTTWYYYDSNGQKQGPITGGQLKGLAKTGKIFPDTVVESEKGRNVAAREIKGLNFLKPTPPESLPSTSPQKTQHSVAVPPEKATTAPAPPAEGGYGLASPLPANPQAVPVRKPVTATSLIDKPTRPESLVAFKSEAKQVMVNFVADGLLVVSLGIVAMLLFRILRMMMLFLAGMM